MTDASEVRLECGEDLDEAASDARAGALFREWNMDQIGDEDCSNPVRASLHGSCPAPAEPHRAPAPAAQETRAQYESIMDSMLSFDAVEATRKVMCFLLLVRAARPAPSRARWIWAARAPTQARPAPRRALTSWSSRRWRARPRTRAHPRSATR